MSTESPVCSEDDWHSLPCLILLKDSKQSIIHQEGILSCKGARYSMEWKLSPSSHPQFVISFSTYRQSLPHLFLVLPPSLTHSLPPTLLSQFILHHFNNSKWYIKVNEICHTSGHYDACQGFVPSVHRTAAAHQRPVLLPHQVEYWISKVLKNTIAPLISTGHNLWRPTTRV